MKRIRPEDWRPAGGITLEDAAERIVRSPTSTSVVAGPGAGKTELLAQRAVFLLQAGGCPPPRRILAISFKRDAARNLKERVGQRCSPEQSNRFDSLTFDAFAKSLVDRFLALTPTWCRPRRDYRVIFPGRRDWTDFLARIEPPWDLGGEAAARSLRIEEVERWGPLPLVPGPPATMQEWVSREWWAFLLSGPRPALTFAMIGQLADAILRYNASLLAALRLTYSHVFLDEFQDTTRPQFSLTKLAFDGSQAVLTAVGDTKQRIMTWAGAEADVFTWFDEAFGARRERLQMNHRSNARIVQIINDLVIAIEPFAVPTVCARAADPVPSRGAEFWVFKTNAAEAKAIADFVADDIAATPGREPDSFALLVRVKADIAEKPLARAFANRGLRLRNEARLVGSNSIQDLMADELSILVRAVLRLGTGSRDALAYGTVLDALGGILGTDYGSPAEVKKLDDRLKAVVRCVEDRTLRPPSETNMATLVSAIVDRVNSQSFRRAYPQYDSDEFFNGIMVSLAALLTECSEGVADWDGLLDAVDGKGQIRLLTIHKSKGLEYHTVIFVGLHDSAFFGYRDNAQEETNTFFVALSRARERVFFTQSQEGGSLAGIRGLVRLLASAKVPTLEMF